MKEPEQTPNEQKIAELKAKFSDRSLHEVVLENEDEAYLFVMTGPTRAEYEKFQSELNDVIEKKKGLDKTIGIRDAVERAAIAQIRWPERPEAQAIFARFPTMSLQLADKIHGMAGDSFEVRSKKL